MYKAKKFSPGMEVSAAYVSKVKYIDLVFGRNNN
jgi:hypothetical protein